MTEKRKKYRFNCVQTTTGQFSDFIFFLLMAVVPLAGCNQLLSKAKREVKKGMKDICPEAQAE